MIDPTEDGKSHINIYSKGQTELGRFLSNFSECNVHTDDGFFRTIEGYWYWLSCLDDRLRYLPGYQAKKLGRELKALDWNNDPRFEYKISKAIVTKILASPWCKVALICSGTKPLYHYYTYGKKVIMPKDGLWMVTLIEKVRNELLEGKL